MANELEDARRLARVSKELALDFFRLALDTARVEYYRDPQERGVSYKLYARIGLGLVLDALDRFESYAFYVNDDGVVLSHPANGSRFRMIQRLKLQAKRLDRIASMMEEADAKKAAGQG